MEVVMSFIQRYWDLFINLIRQFTFRDAIDVLVVSFIIYSGIKLVRESRAEQLVKGILILLIVWACSSKNSTRSNFAKAQLLVYVISIVIGILLYIVLGAAVFSSMSGVYY